MRPVHPTPPEVYSARRPTFNARGMEFAARFRKPTCQCDRHRNNRNPNSAIGGTDDDKTNLYTSLYIRLCARLPLARRVEGQAAKKGFAITGFLSTDDENGIQRIVGKS